MATRPEGRTVMDRNKAESMLTEARAELTTAESAVTYLKQVVSGLEGLLKTSPVSGPVFQPDQFPDAPADKSRGGDDAVPDDPPPVYPRTPEAVLRVLRARPNYPMTFKQVWAEMSTGGLIDPSIKSGRNAYTNAIRRLANNPTSGVTRDDHDRYTYSTNPGTAPQDSPADAFAGANTAQHLQAVKS